MYVAGFSINILTLLSIVLATGLVVDDGIVVTENIFRKMEEGFPIRKAALEGSKEIFFAVISTSLTLAVVFMPVVFLQGFVGRLFREFGVVLASAVDLGFCFPTITPVLNVVLTKKCITRKILERTEPAREWKRIPSFTGGVFKNPVNAWVITTCAGIVTFRIH
jgi:HAE1 family hydrophobic/amphiphilic exporter-1/multidrug efflux pump